MKQSNSAKREAFLQRCDRLNEVAKLPEVIAAAHVAMDRYDRADGREVEFAYQLALAAKKWLECA